MKILPMCWIIIPLAFIKIAWSIPFTLDGTSPSSIASPFLSVTNQDNTTKIWAKTYSGKVVLLWQHHPILDNDQEVITFKTDQEGDYFSLQTAVGDNQTGVTFSTTVVDLRNGQVTQPSATLDIFTSDGIGLYFPEQNQNIALLKPIFGPCANPTIINLNKENLKLGYVTDPEFEDNTHLDINYVEQGYLEDPGKYTINPSKIIEQCNKAKS